MGERRHLCAHCRHRRAAWSVYWLEEGTLHTSDVCDPCLELLPRVGARERLWKPAPDPDVPPGGIPPPANS
jgi:hypothetical protein